VACRPGQGLLSVIALFRLSPLRHSLWYEIHFKSPNLYHLFQVLIGVSLKIFHSHISVTFLMLSLFLRALKQLKQWRKIYVENKKRKLFSGTELTKYLHIYARWEHHHKAAVRLIVLSHWPHVATHVADAFSSARQFHSPEVAAARRLVTAHVASVKGLGNIQVERLVSESFHTGDMCSDLCGNLCGDMWPVWKHYNVHCCPLEDDFKNTCIVHTHCIQVIFTLTKVKLMQTVKTEIGVSKLTEVSKSNIFRKQDKV